MRRVLPWIAVLGLAAIANLAGRLGNRRQAARAARGEKISSSDVHIFGAFLLAGAAAMAVQTLYGCRHGWAYAAFWQKVYREDNPKKFAFQLAVQSVLVVIVAYFGLRALSL